MSSISYTPPSYAHNAKLVRVVDGDTLIAELDLGFGLTQKLRLRLARINAPELSTLEGKKAKASIEVLLHGLLNGQMVVETKHTDDYGRWVSEIWLIHTVKQDEAPLNVSDWMVAQGQAVPFMVHG